MIISDDKSIIQIQKNYNKKIISLLDKLKDCEATSEDFDEPCLFFMDLLSRCLVGTEYYENSNMLSNKIISNENLLEKFKVPKTKDEIIEIIKSL